MGQTTLLFGSLFLNALTMMTMPGSESEDDGIGSVAVACLKNAHSNRLLTKSNFFINPDSASNTF